jgi:hypothetical protein
MDSMRRIAAVALLGAALVGCDKATAVPEAASVELSAAEASLLPDATHTFTATVRSTNGSVMPSAVVQWSSSDTRIASVEGGVVTAVAPGTAEIRAASGTTSARATVTVRAGGVVGASGGTAVTADSSVVLTFPAGAVPANTPVTITAETDTSDNPHVLGGSVHHFGPSGTQFSQPVQMRLKYDASALPQGTPLSALRVAKRVDGAWQPIEEGAMVDSVTGTVSASVRSFSTFGAVVDACSRMPRLEVGITAGEITHHDCFFTTVQRYRHYYHFTTTPGQASVISSTAVTLNGRVVLKEYTTPDWHAGAQWVGMNLGSTLRVIGGNQRVQLYVTGAGPKDVGRYSLQHYQEPAGHRCGRMDLLLPGASIEERLSSSSQHSAFNCLGTVRFSPFPEINGKPLVYHLYAASLAPGRDHTITVDQIGTRSNITLAVFRNGSPVGVVTPSESPSRSITVRGDTTQPSIVVVEVSIALIHPDQTANDTYRLSVSR